MRAPWQAVANGFQCQWPKFLRMSSSPVLFFSRQLDDDVSAALEVSSGHRRRRRRRQRQGPRFRRQRSRGCSRQRVPRL